MLKKVVLFVSIAMSGCATTHTQNSSHNSEYEAVANLSIASVTDEIKEAAKSIGRLESIENIAFKAGLSKGMRWRNSQINAMLAKLNHSLSIAFNFEQVLIDGRYLPPRVDVIDRNLAKDSDGNLLEVARSYRISTKPELVTQTPTYLNYLYRFQADAFDVNRLGLPIKDIDEEVEAWKTGVNRGWLVGVRQADAAFTEDVNLLKRDFSGILRYYELVSKGMLPAADISRTRRGIVMSADGKVLNIGDEVTSINSEPLFRSPHVWKVLGEGFGSSEQEGAE